MNNQIISCFAEFLVRSKDAGTGDFCIDGWNTSTLWVEALP
jgi:hypothetical protein